jgi:hypothetical protein
MDEQDRQNIFEHIQICVRNLKIFLEEASNKNHHVLLLSVKVNVVIILYLIYTVSTVLFELAEEEQKAPKNRYKCKVPKIVPNQKSAKEAYIHFSISLNRLIRDHQESLFTSHILNHFQPLQHMINCYLEGKSEQVSTGPNRTEQVRTRLDQSEQVRTSHQ